MRARPPLRKIFLIIILAQGAVALGLLLYLAVTGKAVILEVTDREELRAPDSSSGLIIPVAGVRPSQLSDTYGAPRSGGRTHEGIDILAPEGTPVLAAAAAVVVGRDSSDLGGISLYLRDLDNRTIYFHGHLQGYRSGLQEGDLVRQGEVIAYVGQTGNVPPGRPHLHFSVYTVTDPNRWWRGRNLNPCDLLPCGPTQDESGS